MSTETLTKEATASLLREWKQEKPARMGEAEELYPTDFVVHAWQDGYKKGFLAAKLRDQEDASAAQIEKFINEYRQLIQQKVVELAFLRNRIYDRLKELGFHPAKAYLRDDISGVFDLLILVGDQDFSSKEFRAIYADARTYKNSVCDENFHVNVKFLPSSGELNLALIVADGYRFSHTINVEGAGTT